MCDDTAVSDRLRYIESFCSGEQGVDFSYLLRYETVTLYSIEERSAILRIVLQPDFL